MRSITEQSALLLVTSSEVINVLAAAVMAMVFGFVGCFYPRLPWALPGMRRKQPGEVALVASSALGALLFFGGLIVQLSFTAS